MDAGSVNQDGSFYQDILKYVLHKQIQTLVSQLLEETGDETIVLSASVDSGTVTQFGSERAKAFISKDCNVATDFLDFIRKDPNKESAARKLSSKSSNHGKRTQEAIDGTEDIQPSAKVAKICKVLEKPDVADFSSTGCSNKSSSQYAPQREFEKSNDTSGPTPKLPAEDEFGGMRPQHLAEDKFGSLLPLAQHSAVNKIPETLEMNAYTEEEQTSLLNYMEMKSKMINSKGDNATTAKTVPDSQEFGMKNIGIRNIKCGLADSDVVPPVNDSVKEAVDGNVVNSDSDGSIQGIDDFPKIIIKTEPCDTDANDSLESTAESVDQSDNVCSDLPRCSRTFVFGNKFTRYASDSTAESGSHLSNSSGGETDVRSSEEKSNASKGSSLDSQRVDSIQAPVFKAKGRQRVKPNKRFQPFENAFVSKQKGQYTEESTKHSTKWAVTILKEWIKESDMDCEGFELWPDQQLDSLLEKFYSCIRTQKGKEYSRPSLIGIRAGINRYLTDPPFSRKISLMKDSVFTRSNRVIEGRIDYLKSKQLDVIEHKEPISESDMKKLYQSGVFSTENPKTLQRKVQFELLLHFGRRGKEGLRYLKKDSFALETDSSGVRYVTMRFNDGDKIHHGLDDKETLKNRRMYEKVGDKHCPVFSFLKYVSKLNPMCDAFFQRPMSMIVTERHNVWYGNQPVGINTLNTLMPRLSADAGLSTRYTNHCIETTRKCTLQSQRAVLSNTVIISVKGEP